MRVEVDREVCIGAGLCVTAAPGVFEQDEDGVVVLLDDAPGPNRRSEVAYAERLCPARAIEITQTPDE